MVFRQWIVAPGKVHLSQRSDSVNLDNAEHLLSSDINVLQRIIPARGVV